MKPSKPLESYVSGLKNVLKKYGATQRDQYSWIAKTDKYYIFTAETDHKDKLRNVYSHFNGTFEKRVRPLSKENGDAPLTVSHGKELFEAAKQTFESAEFCKLLLVKGTKYGSGSGGIKAVMDNDLWKIAKFEGTIDNGFEFVIERQEQN